MSKGQIVLIAGALVLLFGLYFLGSQTPATLPQLSKSTTAEAENQENFDIAAFEKSTKEKITESVLQEISIAEQQTTNNADNNLKNAAYKRLAKLWEEQGQFLLSGYYLEKGLKFAPTVEGWNLAGNLFLQHLRHDDPALRQFAAEHAINCYQETLKLDEANEVASINLAIAYIDGESRVMEGVQLLLGVVKRDPDNIDATMILGQLAIESMQYEKAIMRFEKVTQLQEDNSEAWLLLAQAYAANQEKEKAIAALEKCKKLVDNPALNQQIDQQIQNIKDPSGSF